MFILDFKFGLIGYLAKRLCKAYPSPQQSKICFTGNVAMSYQDFDYNACNCIVHYYVPSFVKDKQNSMAKELTHPPVSEHILATLHWPLKPRRFLITNTRKSVRESKMNEVARAQLIFQMLTVPQNHLPVSQHTPFAHNWLCAYIASNTSQHKKRIFVR